MTIPELETEMLYIATPNGKKRLKWYKQHDKIKFLKELAKLWRKYSEAKNG